MSQHEEHYGIASHIVTEAFAAVGVQVEYGFFPWQRSYVYAKKGTDSSNHTWHGTLVWMHTEDRAKDFYYSDAVITTEEVLFHLKSNEVKWDVIADLKGKTIGGTQHTSYPELESASQEGIIELDRAGDYESLFNRLVKKRVDAVPHFKDVGIYYLKKLPEQQREIITHSPTIIRKKKYYVIFSKELDTNPDIIKQFNKGLDIIKKNGLYDQILTGT